MVSLLVWQDQWLLTKNVLLQSPFTIHDMWHVSIRLTAMSESEWSPLVLSILIPLYLQKWNLIASMKEVYLIVFNFLSSDICSFHDANSMLESVSCLYLRMSRGTHRTFFVAVSFLESVSEENEIRLLVKSSMMIIRLQKQWHFKSKKLMTRSVFPQNWMSCWSCQFLELFISLFILTVFLPWGFSVHILQVLVCCRLTQLADKRNSIISS